MRLVKHMQRQWHLRRALSALGRAQEILAQLEAEAAEAEGEPGTGAVAPEGTRDRSRAAGRCHMSRTATSLGWTSDQLAVAHALVDASVTADGYAWVAAATSLPTGWTPTQVAATLDILSLTGHVGRRDREGVILYIPNLQPDVGMRVGGA